MLLDHWPRANGGLEKIDLYWMDDVWSKIDLTVRPSRSWRDLMQERCYQVRDKTSQLGLAFSGGYDSQTILERVFFSRLRSGQQIYPHQDAPWGTNFESNIRYGLVITTNPDCIITAINHTSNPAPGTIFWFDNCQQHSATNLGNTDRIYLYMDVKPLN